MKKIVLVILLAVLMAPAAMAEDIDLSKYTYNDLRQLIIDCQTEIMSRPEFKSADIPAGVYLVGTDIPAGKWTITMISNATEVCVYRDIYTYDQELSIPEFDQILSSYTDVTEIGSLYLRDGEVLVIEGSVTIRPFTGFGL